MTAAIDLLPLLLLAVLPMLFIVQFFSSHSRSAAWSAPATVHPPIAARPFAADVTDLTAARAARNAADGRNTAVAAIAA